MGVEFFSMLEASFYTTFRIIFISSSGFILVKSGIINKTKLKGIAEMTANFLIPCLSVAEICKSFHINNYDLWLPILIYCLFNVGVGYLIGEVVCSLNKDMSPEIRRLILISCMFSNSTSMQLIYIESLSGILAEMVNTTETVAKSRGYIVVLIYTIFVNFLRWSVGYNIMKPDKKIFTSGSPKTYAKNDSRRSLNSENTSINSEVSKSLSVRSSKQEEISKNKNTELKVVNQRDDIRREEKFETCMKMIKEGVNMPFIAGVAAIIISSVPYVNTFFSQPDSVGYKLLTEPCESVGRCVSVFVILTLGLNLSLSLNDPDDDSEPLDKKIIASVLFTKAVIFPILGLLSIWALGYKTSIIKDPLLCFLLLTNFCTPTAINMITIAIINKFQVNNLSKLLVYQYAMGIITVTIWTAIYMNLFL